MTVIIYFQTRRLRCLSALLGTLTIACGSPPPPPPVQRPVYAEMAPGSYMLTRPIENPESLLGRAVQFNPNGGIEIAERVDPRCEVSIKTSRDRWKNQLHQGIRYIAGTPSTLTHFFSGRDKSPSNLRMVTDIDNHQVMTADLKGHCGLQVIKRIGIGTGKQSIYHKTLDADTGQTHLTEDPQSAVSWNEPKAWSITLTTDRSPSEIYINMPDKISVMDTFSPTISTSSRDLWLIVLSCDAENQCWILRPSPDIPEVPQKAFETSNLPPLAASFPAKEHMVVYGFPEESDYRKYAPKKGSMTQEECTIFNNRLYARLKDGELPKERWTRAIFRYEVVPTVN